MCLLCSLLVGCGGTSDEPAPKEWSIQEEAIRLEREIQVGDDNDFYFGSVRDLAVGGKGRMYVADGDAHHVKILSPDGTLLDSLGTQGEGPGEFERLDQVFSARGDSLFVLDGYYGRLSAFSPDQSFAYRISLRAARSRPIRIMLHSSGYVGEYFRLARPNEEDQKNGAARLVSMNGTPRDTLFTYPPPQMHVEKLDRGTRVRAIPFAREPHVVMGPAGHVHYAWSDSLTVVTYDRTGTPRDTVALPFEPVPVTEADREEVFSNMSAETEAALKNEIPPTKPAFEHFLVDDTGRYWFGRPTADSDSTSWWIVRPDEKRVMTDTLPSEVEILTVKNGRAYGRTTTEMGAPAVVRYRIES